MVQINVKYANKSNYGNFRNVNNIKYIVIHYTAGDGDTDENNAKYFANNYVGASAHYFVDSNSITQSVPDNYVAWSVGGKKYNNAGGRLYGKCTNNNSISIEICDDVKNGVIYPSAKTIQKALDLTELLMKKYNVPKENVIRHYDVNGKPCPKYWVEDVKWKSEFWNKIEPTSSKPDAFEPYLVKINTDTLNVRSKESIDGRINAVVKRGEVFTIVAERDGWGKLKSGVGWIKLSYTIKL